MKRRVPLRALRVVILSLLVADLAYAVAAGIFLHSRFFDSVVNGNPEEMYVRTEGAYSPWPGAVYARSILVRGQDPSVQWSVEVEHARVGVSLRDLLMRKKLHFTHVDAESGVFRLRSRTLAERPEAAVVAEMPPIEGFAPETARASLSALAERAEARENEAKARAGIPQHTGLREVRIDRVRIPGFREIWVGAYRYTGRLGVSGEFALEPGTRLRIPRARLDFETGTLDRGGRGVLSAIRGRLDAAIRDYDLDHGHGLDIFGTLSSEVQLSGKLDSLDPFAYLLRSQDWFAIRRAEGDFKLALGVAEGQISRVDEVSLVARELRARFSHFVLEAGGGRSVRGAAQADFVRDPHGQGILEFRLPSYRILTDRAGLPVARGNGLSISLVSPDLKLAHLFRRLTARLQLAGAHVDDFAFVNRWLPAAGGISILGGSGELAASVTVSNDHRPGPGWARFTTQDLRVRKDQANLRGEIRATARVQQLFHGMAGPKELRISGTELRVRGLRDRPGAVPWETELRVIEGTIRPDDEPQIRAMLTCHLPDVSPFLAEFGVQSGVAKIAQNLLLSGSFDASAVLTLGERRIDLDRIELVSPKSRAEGLLHLRDGREDALALVRYSPFRVGLRLDAEGTEVRLHGADEWYHAQSVVLSAPRDAPVRVSRP